jgi:hypothetical protein
MKQRRIKWTDIRKAWNNGRLMQNYYESFRENFDRGRRRRWNEKLQNNLKEYFENVEFMELEQVRNQWRDFFKDWWNVRVP